MSKTIERPGQHVMGQNGRPALYIRVSEDMLREMNRLRVEMSVPVRGLVINALLCTYPHLAVFCEKEKVVMERYFTAEDRRQAAGVAAELIASANGTKYGPQAPQGGAAGFVQ